MRNNSPKSWRYWARCASRQLKILKKQSILSGGNTSYEAEETSLHFHLLHRLTHNSILSHSTCPASLIEASYCDNLPDADRNNRDTYMTEEEWDQIIREALALIYEGKAEQAFWEFSYNVGGNLPDK